MSHAAVDAAIAGGSPASLAPRDYTFALFDAGALHCRSRPRCHGCPLRPGCASAAGPATAPTRLRRRRSPPYPGSLRELRGALLRAFLDDTSAADEVLARRVSHLAAAANTGTVIAALAGLRSDGLLGSAPRHRR